MDPQGNKIPDAVTVGDCLTHVDDVPLEGCVSSDISATPRFYVGVCSAAALALGLAHCHKRAHRDKGVCLTPQRKPQPSTIDRPTTSSTLSSGPRARSPNSALSAMAAKPIMCWHSATPSSGPGSATCGQDLPPLRHLLRRHAPALLRPVAEPLTGLAPPQTLQASPRDGGQDVPGRRQRHYEPRGSTCVPNSPPPLTISVAHPSLAPLLAALAESVSAPQAQAWLSGISRSRKSCPRNRLR